MTITGDGQEIRDRLAIALDVSDLDTAVSIAKAVRPYIGIAKIGLQLFSATGPVSIQALQDVGMDIFLDLKLHDIPNTVYGASKVLASLGIRYLTVHTSGGTAMLRAAKDGFREGATQAPAPIILAVTVLTSEPEASPELLRARLGAAVDAGCRAVVCAAPDLPVVKEAAPDILTVVPGIRPEGTPTHDQGRVATPAAAIRSGADILVLGRAITDADDPAAAAQQIADEATQGLMQRSRVREP